LAIAFPDFIKTLGRFLGPEVKKIGTSLIIVVLSNLEIARVIKVRE
jgi:hypothetical protein